MVSEIPNIEVFKDHLSGRGYRILEVLANKSPTSLLLPLNLYRALPFKAEMGLPVWVYVTESLLDSYSRDSANSSRSDSITTLFVLIQSFIKVLSNLGCPIIFRDGQHTRLLGNQTELPKNVELDQISDEFLISETCITHKISYVPFLKGELNLVVKTLVPEPIVNQLTRFNLDVFTYPLGHSEATIEEIQHG